MNWLFIANLTRVEGPTKPIPSGTSTAPVSNVKIERTGC